MTIGGLTFLYPLALLGLLSLPVIWWLLRITPPAPKRVFFPPLRLLFGLETQETQAQNTPLWLLLMRLLACLLIILALSAPYFSRETVTADEGGRTIIIIDNGWASAHNWDEVTRQAARIIDRAAQAGGQILLLPTAPDLGTTGAPDFLLPSDAHAELRDLSPRPWTPDRQQALSVLEDLDLADANIYWLSDGLDHGAAQAIATRLQSAKQAFLQTDAETPPLLLTNAQPTPLGVQIDIERPWTSGPDSGRIDALGDGGRILASELFAFGEQDLETTAEINLPLEVRNKISLFRIAQDRSSASTLLLDESFRRRRVGILAPAGTDLERPLLSDVFYLERATTPFTDVTAGTLVELLSSRPDVLFLPDAAQILRSEFSEVTNWIADGGVLIRFAGLRLANQQDLLIPLRLRQGSRSLGSMLSWDKPQGLSAFGTNSPFYGLAIPVDVEISQQVLAEPASVTDDLTWARLADGTPLVTAKPVGEGWMILFHIPATPDWSSLPLSGLFVEMLERLVSLSSPSGFDPQSDDRQVNAYAPISVLDGFGNLQNPSPLVPALKSEKIETWKASPSAPPGLYGTVTTPIALNLANERLTTKPLATESLGLTLLEEDVDTTMPLKPLLASLALLLLIADGLAVMFIAGHLQRLAKLNFSRAAGLLLSFGLAASIGIEPTRAQTDDARAIEATRGIHLGFVRTGNPVIDDMSEAGLFGLTQMLLRRTAVEPGRPLGINLEADELAFFPFIYWPISKDQTDLSADALHRIDAYLKNGGTILFDMRDEDQRFLPRNFNRTAATENEGKLREILSNLDLPPLQRVPEDHVLTKSFYLLREFPGRWAGDDVWVENQNTQNQTATSKANDGVSSVIIGNNDWASAWAIDRNGNPIAPVSPGGARQRELAYRFGVNIVMYTLTGNYKADQVHVPALLERLGQ